jgi:hypothetical protein
LWILNSPQRNQNHIGRNFPQYKGSEHNRNHNFKLW